MTRVAQVKYQVSSIVLVMVKQFLYSGRTVLALAFVVDLGVGDNFIGED
jgi:hypothetical protein